MPFAKPATHPATDTTGQRRKASFICTATAAIAAAAVTSIAMLPSASNAAQQAPTTQAQSQTQAAAPAFPEDAFPAEWHFYGNNPERWQAIRARVQPIIGKQATKFDIGPWHNEGGETIEELRGNVVLVDFWATWCRPCINAIPKINAIQQKYEGKGLKVVAICNVNGGEKMVETATQHSMAYPTAVDLNKATAEAYNVQFWPFYVLLDRQGVVRAAGLSSDNLGKAVEKLLEIEEQRWGPFDPSAATDTTARAPAGLNIPREWREGDDNKRQRLAGMEGVKAPELSVANWMNANFTSLADLQGKIVVVDFWATWCGPCIASIPKLNGMHEKYRDNGVVVLGVCHERGHEKMLETAREHGIAYPIAADTSGETRERWKPDGYPDYFIIGRDGTVTVADARNGAVEDIIKAMLKAEGAR